MANVTITQLPPAGPITGAESVAIVQAGQTVKTTTGAIAASPSQPYTYLTVTQTSQLANSRYVGATNGLSITDNGAQGLFNISTTGALLSLVNSGTGIQVKTSGTAISGRSIDIDAGSAAGLSVTNGDGVAGNPTIALTGQLLNLANLSANGLMVIKTSGAVSSTSILNVADQTSVTNADGTSGNPTIGLASNPVIPGIGAIQIPAGATGDRPSGAPGKIRYNTSDSAYEGYSSGSWRQFSLSGGVIEVDTGTGLTGGPITGVGTISIANTTVTSGSYGSGTQVGAFTVNAQGQLTAASNVTITASGIGAVASVTGTANEITATGTTNVVLSLPTALTFTGKTVTDGTFNMTAATVGSDTVTTNTAAQTLTNKTISGASNTLSNIGNSSLTNSSVTINGSSVSLGGSITVTATASNALTIGTGLSGASYNGSSPVTIAIDSTVATLTGAQTLTNKTISGSNNTFSNIANASLTNSSVTIGSTAISLGGTSTTLAGLTSVTLTQDPVAALQAATKQYVDNVASGINFHNACYYATTVDLGSVTYNNGALGVGATITNAGAQAVLVIDGHTFTSTDASNAVRILVKNESNGAYNGIYTLTNQGSGSTNWVLTRATDYDSTGSGTNEIDAGDLVLVLYGTANANTSWVQQTPLPIIIGTTAIVFVQFAAPITYTAGTGLTLAGTTFSITNTAVTAGAYGSATQVGTFTVNAQGQLTLAGNTTVTPAVGSITGLGTGVATALAIAVGTAGSFVVNGGALGTPSSGTLTNATGLPVSTGISGLGTGVATALAVNTGSVGGFVVNGGALGTPSSGTLTSVTGLPLSTGVTGTLPVGNAGTGITSYAVGDILYASGTTTLSKLALGTQGSVLTAGATGPTWSGISGGTF